MVAVAVSAPLIQKKAEAQVPVAARASRAMPLRATLIGGLEVGLAGPPVVGADGGWWLLGRDGEVERFGPDDSLKWSISIAASINGASATDESGRLVYIPTARDLIVALDRDARVHWKYKAPAGVVGDVCWVPKQGLVFIGRDRLLYWLDLRANLVLRAPLKSAVTAGPAPFGNKVIVGTEDGQVLAFSRQGTRQVMALEAPIRAIAPMSQGGALVLAARVAHVLDATLSEQSSIPSALAIGVTASRGHALKSTPLMLTESGELRGVEWAPAATAPTRDFLFAPALEATSTAAWATDESGALWQARPEPGWERIQLGHAPLLRPVLDINRGRILVGSEGGSVWSVPVQANTE